MRGFRSRDRSLASPSRRAVLGAGAALALTACGRGSPLTASTTPRLDLPRLTDEIGALARRAAPGVLGVGLMNLESGEIWQLNGKRRFPMASVFKAVLGAAALAEVDGGRLSLDERFVIEAEQLSPPYSPIAEAWPARRDYTARELLAGAVGLSDNTAADVLMRRIGGPGAVTAWLDAEGVADVRVDRYEREILPDCFGMASFRPAWRGPAFAQAMATVPPALRLAAVRAYMADPRDTATPLGMLEFLARLDAGELVSQRAARLLVQIMLRSPAGAGRLRAGLPPGARLAHKLGTILTGLGVQAAVNDVGILTLADRRSYAVAAFLTGAERDEAACDALFADITRSVVRSVG